MTVVQEGKAAQNGALSPRIEGRKEEDPNFDRKLDLITAGARPFVKEHLLTRITKENCLIIIQYVLAFQLRLTRPNSTELTPYSSSNSLLNTITPSLLAK